MKLAEALQERADLNRRIQQLQGRLNSNAVVQEGERPPENPQELLRELDGCIAQLEALIGQINLTNCRTELEGESLTQLLARRDALKLKLGAYRDLAYSASQLARRGTRSEIRLLSTVDVKRVQKQVDEMARDLRQLDNRIQAANWTTELLT